MFSAKTLGKSGCYENSDLENIDLRPRKTHTPWVSRKHRPSIQYFSNIDVYISEREKVGWVYFCHVTIGLYH